MSFNMNSKNIFIILALFVFTTLSVFWYFNQNQTIMKNKTSISGISYVPIGDSYTIGYGVSEEDRWPNVLTNHLKKEGIDITLVSNPASSGYTVRDAIDFELPQVKRIKPDFVTVLIGANDNFGSRDVETFRKDLIEFLDKLELILKNPKNIILITIPDYSISPQAAGFDREGLSKSIEEYNMVIKGEAYKRGLKVADIFPVSQAMTRVSDYTKDGLHPSSQGYANWEKVIFPVVFDLLKSRN